ncbi:MAG: hypothetical protein AAGA60_31860 [Cyanobacteria bacterium P01_E01_bin.42]
MQAIGDREIKDLVNLPEMIDEEKIAIVRIASSILPAAYISSSPLFPPIAALSVKLSIEYGNTLASAACYVWYSHIVCDLLKDTETGVEFAQLAIQLTSKPDAKAFRAEVLDIGGFGII